MSAFVEHFHLLRPWWLLALIPLLGLAWLVWRQKYGAHQWQKLIAPALLPYLEDAGSRRPRRHLLWGLIGAWCLAVLALAGPTWEQRPTAAHTTGDALVVVLDLSPSMLAEDINPSRLVRARLKVADILQRRTEGETALISYAGDAHVVSPLTDDSNTIINLLQVLHPSLMPLPGSNTEAAIEQAEALLANANVRAGHILLVTDGVVSSARDSIRRQLEDSPHRLSILGVGTEDGAPIPSGSGGFVRDRSNNIIVARLESRPLQQLAGQLDGRYHTLTSDERDLDYLLADTPALADAERESGQQFDTWYDRGPWLVLFLLPVALYSFRRGLLAALICAPLLLATPQTSYALGAETLWLNRDQQAQRQLERANALYRAGDYEAAAQAFAEFDQPRAHYNRGNALARSGDLEGALDAYDQALEADPDFDDARFNRELVEQLLDQQEDQSQDQDSDNGDDEGEPGENGQDGGDGDQQQNGEPQQGPDDDSAHPDDADANDEDSAQDEPQEPGEEQTGDDQTAADEELEDRIDEVREQLAQEEGLSDEERQSLEQWLRRVPDDPGGLLRRKFEHQHQQQQRQRMRERLAPAAPDAEERW
ncbi:VWA domain-containing protein [Marinimicrobium alkaliphilum]|uniref:VWA domain-containing protein n=1 Tax=Marinimicrobium alkaliphilum TaxID=2202654 RepID=UPI000DBA79F7|nr:VWA domain-containing protein [Marinimicrobium alkaliphilum]